MKTKLTFVYDNGKSFTTSRNVSYTCDFGDQFMYEISYKKDGIYREERFYINKSDLIAILFHRNEDDLIQVKMIRKNAGYSIELSHKGRDEESNEECTYVHNFGSRFNDDEYFFDPSTLDD